MPRFALALAGTEWENVGFGKVLVVCVVGMAVVFAVLAILYFAMLLMGRILANKNGKEVSVTSPFNCVITEVKAVSAVKENDVVAVVTCDDGKAQEILAPVSGNISPAFKVGDKIKKGQKLFTVR